METIDDKEKKIERPPCTDSERSAAARGVKFFEYWDIEKLLGERDYWKKLAVERQLELAKEIIEKQELRDQIAALKQAPK